MRKVSQTNPSKNVEKTRITIGPVYIEPINLADDGIERYEDHRGKAKMLIFNQIEFDNPDILKFENGLKEGYKIYEIFEKFGFYVEHCPNLEKKQILTKLKEVLIQKVPKELKCIAIVVLSHGEKGKIWAKDTLYEEKDILECFKEADDLKGVPKLFIFDICRVNTPMSLSLPDKDMIVIHSTYFNEIANVDPTSGSWFIQTLCKRLDLMTKENLLLDEMTFVLRNMSVKSLGKQMPVICYNINKRFYLNPCK